jgi:hypothetical protein
MGFAKVLIFGLFTLALALFFPDAVRGGWSPDNSRPEAQAVHNRSTEDDHAQANTPRIPSPGGGTTQSDASPMAISPPVGIPRIPSPSGGTTQADASPSSMSPPLPMPPQLTISGDEIREVQGLCRDSRRPWTEIAICARTRSLGR